MESHQIRYFLSVYETCNFTRAAQRCFVSQPALTQAIKKLDEELGGLLFQRERKRVRPKLDEELGGAVQSDQPYLDRLSCEMRDKVLVLCANQQNDLYATFRSEREDLI